MGRGIIEAKHDTQIYRSFCAPYDQTLPIPFWLLKKKQLQYSHRHWMTVADGEPVTLFITRQVTRATHVRNRVCPREELILKIIIILLIIFIGFIKSKPC